MMEKQPELLSPAGNAQALCAAVQSGADAVYIGGMSFSARRSAKNFSIEEIRKCTDYCHLYGVDLHVAVNTLIKDRELGALIEYIEALNDAGVDALIVQDMGAAALIRKICPSMPLHASTQMTVTSVDGVKFLEDMGFSRVVLARELTAEEIDNIVKSTKIEIEVFVHGAICMCYSGQCLMSSIIGGRSANRGACAQPCRLPYELCTEGEKGISAYALSPKDMALINELNTLKKIGVTSLKIEGRLKRAKYVSAVTGIYRKYLDYPKRVSEADFKELKAAFSRSGFTDGYFKNKLGASMMSHNTPGNNSGNVFGKEAEDRAREGANIRKIPIYINTSFKTGKPLEITAYDHDGHAVTEQSEASAETAINSSLNYGRLREQILKLGQTPFECELYEADVDEGITIRIKEINDLRRRVCNRLISERTKREKREFLRQTPNEDLPYKNVEKLILTAQCTGAAAARECIKAGIERIYVSQELYEELDSEKLIVRAPDIYSEENIYAESVLVSSPAAIKAYNGKKLYGDFRLNVFNSLSAGFYSDLECVILSPELNLREIRDITRKTAAKTEIIVYGRLPLMLMRNCPIKALGKCQGHKNIYTLRDRKNEKFPIMCTKDCRAVLLNSKPIFMADKIKDIKDSGVEAIRLVFTDEDIKDVKRVISAYKRAICGERVENIFKNNDFTRGHFYRGVE